MMWSGKLVVLLLALVVATASVRIVKSRERKQRRVASGAVVAGERLRRRAAAAFPVARRVANASTADRHEGDSPDLQVAKQVHDDEGSEKAEFHELSGLSRPASLEARKFAESARDRTSSGRKEGSRFAAFSKEFSRLGTIDLQELHFVDAAGIIWLLFYVVRFMQSVCFRWPQARNVGERRRKLQEDQQTFYYSEVQEMMCKLKTLRESSPHKAELHFLQKHRTLVQYLSRVASAPGSHRTDTILVEVFRDWLSLWVQAFEQCNLDPETEPTILCAAESLRRAATVAELASVVITESKGKIGALIEDDGQEADSLHTKIAQRKERGSSAARTTPVKFVFSLSIGAERRERGYMFPVSVYILCMRLTIVSAWHALHWLDFAVGIWMAAWLHIHANTFAAVCVAAAAGFNLVLLLMEPSIYESEFLQEERAQLIALRSRASHLQERFSAWTVKCERVRYLWQHQTMYKLDLFEIVCGLLPTPKDSSYDPSSEAIVYKRYTELNQRLRAVSEGMGPAWMYLSDSAQLEWLGMFARQAQRSIDEVKEAVARQDRRHVLQSLDHFYGVLVVRVVAARRLAVPEEGYTSDRNDKHLTPLTDARVVLHLNHWKRKEGQSTKVVKDNLNPRWDEEFVVEAPRHATSFNLEVFNSDEVKEGRRKPSKRADLLPGAEQPELLQQEGIGFVYVGDLREKPGHWIQKSEHLFAAVSAGGSQLDQRKQLDGTLEFQYFFANKVEHLLKLQEAKEARGTLQSLDSFLRAD